MTILDILEFNCKESLDQSNTFSRYHVRYDITIRRTDDNRKLRFEYQCNPKYGKPNLNDCMWCIVSDAKCYEDCDDDIQEFADMLGYEKVKETLSAFNGCKRAYNDLLEFCGEGVYRWLCKHYEDY